MGLHWEAGVCVLLFSTSDALQAGRFKKYSNKRVRLIPIDKGLIELWGMKPRSELKTLSLGAARSSRRNRTSLY